MDTRHRIDLQIIRYYDDKKNHTGTYLACNICHQLIFQANGTILKVTDLSTILLQAISEHQHNG